MRYDHETRKKQNVLRVILCLFMGLVGILGMSVFSLAQAQVTCGDTIGPGGTVTLPNDLTCTGDGLTVTGPVTLDLNGHTVSGPGASINRTGISVLGEKAEILNGTVKNWRTAVDVKGEGKHSIANLTIENNRVGILIESDKNSVINNWVRNNTSGSPRGIRVDGNSNRLTQNYIENTSKGIVISDNSAKNMIDWNIMVGNNAENCQIKGNHNVLVNNVAMNAAQECFLIDIKDSGEPANGNQLVNNTASVCLAGGFVAADGTFGNRIVHNTASGNSVDLLDNNGSCEDNLWIANIAVTANPGCALAPQ